MSEIGRKTVASAFWNYQLESELREEGHEMYLFTDSKSREKCMDEIDRKRCVSVYAHEQCSEECKKRGVFMSYNTYVTIIIYYLLLLIICRLWLSLVH